MAASRGGSRAAVDRTVSREAAQQGAAVVLACLHVQAAKELAWTRTRCSSPRLQAPPPAAPLSRGHHKAHR